MFVVIISSSVFQLKKFQIFFTLTSSGVNPPKGVTRCGPHQPHPSRMPLSLGYILVAVADSMGLHSNVCFETECISMVDDFDTNRKRVRLCNSLLVINNNLGPIFPRFSLSEILHREERPTPISPEFWECFPWTSLLMLWFRGAKIKILS